MSLSDGQQWRYRHREQTCRYVGGWGGRRGWDVYRQKHGNVYITICKTDSQRKLAVWLRDPNQGSRTTQKGGREREVGGRFKGEGAYVYPWLTHVAVW